MTETPAITSAASAARARMAVVRALVVRLRRSGALQALITSFAGRPRPAREARATRRAFAIPRRIRRGALGAQAHGVGGGGPGRTRRIAAPCALAA